MFGVVDKIIESGQDPRHSPGLPQRLRDLVIVAAVPDALSTGLLDVPGDRAERLLSQASGFGPSELTRAADIVNAALMEFRGATAPRLLLELMCARILVPGSDNSTQGFQARLDRLERRLSIDGGAAPAPAAPAPAAPVAAKLAPREEPAPPVEPEEVVEQTALAEPMETPQAEVAVEAALAELEPEPSPAAPAGSMTIADVRRLWPDVLDKIRELRRFAWVMLSQNAQVMSLDGTTLTIALVNPGARDSFVSSRSDEYVQQALHSVLGVTWTIDAIVDPSARPAASSPPTTELAPEPAEPQAPAPPRASSAAAREAMNEQPSAEDSNPDASADRDDPVVDTEDIDPELLLSRELGAEVIGETTGD